jgi:MoaA/NifB/PqqE/SkfB family radical SAM enzyme
MPHCKALYNHLFVDVQGFYAPCCFYKEKKKHSYKDLSWHDYHNSDYMNSIRKNMLDGWDKGCSDCEELEKQSLSSYRQVVDMFCESDEPKIEYIEISCSNKCNIRCRMCGPDFSSKWAETLEVVVPKIENFKQFLSQIDTTHIKVIKYLGGEPFITPEIKILLDWMLTLPNPVKFYCNTNLTLFPKKHIDTLSKFEQVIIGYSIDGVGIVNDYIRQDSVWKTVEQNLELWEKSKDVLNLKSYVQTTVQAYNFHNLSDLKSICDKYELPHSAWKIFGPKEFTLDALPQDYIDAHTDEYNKQFIKDYKYSSELNAQLIEKTKRQDGLLHTSIANFIPELAEFITETE